MYGAASMTLPLGEQKKPARPSPEYNADAGGPPQSNRSNPPRDVPEKISKVEVTASFLARLDSIEKFLAEVDALSAFDKLVARLQTTVIPNLRRFPRMGRPYLEEPPQSTEALAQLARLPAGALDELREYLTGSYLILYTVSGKTVYLLSIRHHRQNVFEFT